MLSLSLQCLSGWTEDPAARQEAEQLLNRFSDRLNGFELYVKDLDALFQWAHALEYHPCLPQPFDFVHRDTAERMLSLPGLSLHLPVLANLDNKHLERLAQALDQVAIRSRVRECTAHPTEISTHTWEVLCNASSLMRISIENMDIRKKCFRTLPEIAQLLELFPMLAVTFDVCHWLEAGRQLEESELIAFVERYRSRISKLHVSVPRSRHEAYEAYGYINHKLAVHSGVPFSFPALSIFGADLLWVMEGFVPARAGSLLEEEISFLERGRSKTSS